MNIEGPSSQPTHRRWPKRTVVTIIVVAFLLLGGAGIFLSGLVAGHNQAATQQANTLGLTPGSVDDQGNVTPAVPCTDQASSNSACNSNSQTGQISVSNTIAPPTTVPQVTCPPVRTDTLAHHWQDVLTVVQDEAGSSDGPDRCLALAFADGAYYADASSDVVQGLEAGFFSDFDHTVSYAALMVTNVTVTGPNQIRINALSDIPDDGGGPDYVMHYAFCGPVTSTGVTGRFTHVGALNAYNYSDTCSQDL